MDNSSPEKTNSLSLLSTTQQDESQESVLQPANPATATAPAYSPIYATAQLDNNMTEIPTPTEPPTALLNPSRTLDSTTGTTTSPPPPQPGAVPKPDGPTEPTSTPGAVTPAIPAEQYTTSPPAPPKPADIPTLAPATNPAPPAPTSTTNSGGYGYGYSYNPNPNAATNAGHSGYGGYSYQTNSSNPAQLPSVHQQPPIPNSTTSPYASLYQASGGATQLPLHNNPNLGLNGVGDEDEGFWGSAKAWLQTAGGKLAEVEAEVWRRINDAHDKD